MTLSLLATLPDGKYFYQCSCGAELVRKKKTTKCPICDPKAVPGRSANPLYRTWQKNFKAAWPDFTDFFLEALSVSPTPGMLPPPIYALRAKIAGTKPRPGNLKYIKQDILYVPDTTDPDAMDKHRKQLQEDPEFRRLWEQAHKELADPTEQSSIGLILNRIENEFSVEKGLSDEALYQEQAQRELDAHDFAKELLLSTDEKYFQKHSGAQTSTGKAIRFQLVPGLAARMEEHYQAGMRAQAGTNLHLVHNIRPYIDFKTMAHITVTVTLDAIGRGTSFQTMESVLYKEIGKRIEHQAYLEHLKQTDPDTFKRVDKLVLKDTVKGYKNKVKKAMKMAGPTEFQFLSNPDCVKLGNWAWANFQSVTLWFDLVKFWNKGINHCVWYVGLSDEGIRQSALIQTAKLDACLKLWPMIHPPKPWGFDGQRGGYIRNNWKIEKLVRGNKGKGKFATTPSQLALDALNHYQSIPFKLNTFIYGVQKALVSTSNDIGAFKSYEKDSWMEEHMPLIDPAVWSLPSVQSEDGKWYTHPDKQAAKRQLKKAHGNRKLAERQKQAPETVLQVAARCLNIDKFYLPMYMDYRLRMYYMVDTLNPQGSDYQKALLLFAEGNPVTDSNREIIRRDLLTTLANNWAGKVEGTHIKSDKLPMKERVEFGRTLANEGAVAAADPLSSSGRSFWTEADEPFQFLATLHEYYSIFIWKNKHVAEVANGRDASNSGMQLQGGFVRDPIMCHYTNVTPSDHPQDAYEVVAEEARKLLQSDEWLADQMEKVDTRIKQVDEERLAKDPEYKPEPNRHLFTLKPEYLTRKVMKRPVMVTGYGGSWESKNSYISDELQDLYLGLFGKDGLRPTLKDKVIATNACIQGQRLAFPKQDEINKWFQSIGKACLETNDGRVRWQTAAGSYACQEYREPSYVEVDTYGMGGARYREILQPKSGREETHRVAVRVGWGDPIDSKTKSALAANWTHSQDASIIQLAAQRLQDFSTYVVHDCAYCPAGCVDEMVMALKVSFLTVVGPDRLTALATENKTGVAGMEVGDMDIIQSLKSEYMFA
jgi:DNA-directed RNA polymerase